MTRYKPVISDQRLSKLTDFEPLPEIAIPQALLQERESGILNLLNNPPDVDCMHLLGRSGPLAAAGLYEDPALVVQLGLPPLISVDRIGSEVYNEWYDMMLARDPEWDGPPNDIGEYAEDEDRAPFIEWVCKATSPNVQNTIAYLRALPTNYRRIAILDDVYQYGGVTLGVAPALYKAAYGDDHQYDPKNNRYIFKLADWLYAIVQATFRSCVPDLNLRQSKLLTELSKGQVDRDGFKPIDPRDIRSLDQLADYSANHYYVNPYRTHEHPPDSVYELIERFGTNLFQLHENLQAVFTSHMAAVLQKLQSSVE